MGHDAYDYWTLAVNACVAAGTIGAVIVALWLAAAGRRAEAKRIAKAEAAERMQVAMVVRPQVNQRAGEWAWVDFVNDSPDLISNVIAEVKIISTEPAAFKWAGEGPPPYVSANGSYRGAGTFYHLKRDGTFNTDSRVDPARTNLRSQLAWQDAHGEWWARSNGGEPYRTSAEQPFTDEELYIVFAPKIPGRLKRLCRWLKSTQM